MRCRADNFETWVVDLIGPTMYSWFIEPYTLKQWGRPAGQLAASWAPKRIELRSDGYLDLFRDPYQGWPRGGYNGLLAKLLAGCGIHLGEFRSAANISELCATSDAVLITAPLDEFFDFELGTLEWRGVRFSHQFVPSSSRILHAGVVNHPGLDESYTRRIETKWMSGQTRPGSIVSYEYPGAPARHYPVDDVAGTNRDMAQRYRQLLKTRFGAGVFGAGRLATYSYINMDQAIRQGINVARSIIAHVAT